MSEDWPSGWYHDDPRQRPEPRYTPDPGADASPYEPTAEADQFLYDPATDQALPESLVTGGTA